MADAALATSSRVATNVSRSERSSGRGPISPVRPVSETDAFQRNLETPAFNRSSTVLSAATEQVSGSSLLSTGVERLLAETRTQEAGASFTPPSRISLALNSYVTTQAKVRDTIRDNQLLGHNGAAAVLGEKAQTPALSVSSA